MRIGIFGGEVGQGAGGIDELVTSVAGRVDDGFASYWLPQIFGLDALTALAVVGREVPGIELGTSVVPTYPRHPMMLAGQALTTQNASGGRLALGIGLSHQIVIEAMWGMSFDKPVRHMREYLSILRPLLYGEAVSFQGESLSTNGALTVAGATAPPILVAALGTQMLNVTGRLADGTITWMTGPATLAEHTVPTLRSAAAEAGRPEAVRVVAGFPVCVTDDGRRPASAPPQEFADLRPVAELPRHARPRRAPKVPADVALVGDEATVRPASTVSPKPASPTSSPPSSARPTPSAPAPATCSGRCSNEGGAGSAGGPAAVDGEDVARAVARASEPGTTAPRRVRAARRCGPSGSCDRPTSSTSRRRTSPPSSRSGTNPARARSHGRPYGPTASPAPVSDSRPRLSMRSTTPA